MWRSGAADLANSANPYILSLGYGAAGSIDDELSRVASLGEQGASRRLADFTFAGGRTGIRTATKRGVLASSGAPSAQELSSSVGFNGLGFDLVDRFGRVKVARADKVDSGGTLSLI